MLFAVSGAFPNRRLLTALPGVSIFTSGEVGQTNEVVVVDGQVGLSRTIYIESVTRAFPGRQLLTALTHVRSSQTMPQYRQGIQPLVPTNQCIHLHLPAGSLLAAVADAFPSCGLLHAVARLERLETQKETSDTMPFTRFASTNLDDGDNHTPSMTPNTAPLSASMSTSMSVTLLPGGARRRRRRQSLDERHNTAGTVIGRFARNMLLKKRLHETLQLSAALLIQRIWRGYTCRRRNHDRIDNMRRERAIVMHYAPLRAIPAQYRLHTAATRIQLMVRRHEAMKRKEVQKLVVAAKKIQATYRHHRWRNQAVKHSNLKSTHAVQSTMIVRIQALVRGYLVRRWLRKNREQLRQEQADRFAVMDKARRGNRVEREARMENDRISTKIKRQAEAELLQMVLTMSNPNKEVVEWSTKRTFESSVQRKVEKKDTRLPPLSTLPLAANTPVEEPFVPNVMMLEPSSKVAAMIQPLNLPPPSTVTTVRKKAEKIAQRRLAERYRYGGDNDDSYTMQYALHANPTGQYSPPTSDRVSRRSVR